MTINRTTLTERIAHIARSLFVSVPRMQFANTATTHPVSTDAYILPPRHARRRREMIRHEMGRHLRPLNPTLRVGL